MTQKLTKFIPIILIVLAGAVVANAFKIRHQRTSPADKPAPDIDPPKIVIPEKVAIPEKTWKVFSFTGEQSAAAKNDKYRLAGTFFLTNTGENNQEGKRLAIIDDIGENHQYIVGEGQNFNDYEILRIYQDRLIMRRDGVEVELTLSFQGGNAAPKNEVQAEGQQTQTVAEVALETSRFGKRIGEKRWVIQKQAIVDYYHELLDNPERIAAIYSSLKPDYLDGSVKGYVLQKEGEADFFNAVGLQEGDTIRKVNSMRMTSQKRAEYFIGEFMKERLGAVVIDIERNGQPEKLIYLFR